MKKLIIFALFALFSKNSFASENNKIVVTIKPLFSLVQSVVGESENVTLLIDNNISEHNFQPKPSHVKILNEADIIFFIDKTLETSVYKILENLPTHIKKAQVSQIKGLKKLPIRNVANSDSRNQDDMHIWLDVENAKKITQYIADELSAIYPQNKAIYRKNAKKTIEKLDLLHKNLQKMTKSLQNKPFITFHDSYQYFEQNYNLSAITSIRIEASESPSALRIREIRQKILEKKVVCVFYEPQFSDKIVKVITQNLDVKIGVLDPIGAALQNDENLYFNMMNNLADNFAKCLR